eukprot:7474396-Pyramimonas_sp.AAC.1
MSTFIMTSLGLQGSAVSPAGWADGATSPLGWADGGTFLRAMGGACPFAPIRSSSPSDKSEASSYIISSEQTDVKSSPDGLAAGVSSG